MRRDLHRVIKPQAYKYQDLTRTTKTKPKSNKTFSNYWCLTNKNSRSRNTRKRMSAVVKTLYCKSDGIFYHVHI